MVRDVEAKEIICDICGRKESLTRCRKENGQIDWAAPDGWKAGATSGTDICELCVAKLQ